MVYGYFFFPFLCQAQLRATVGGEDEGWMCVCVSGVAMKKACYMYSKKGGGKGRE